MFAAVIITILMPLFHATLICFIRHAYAIDMPLMLMLLLLRHMLLIFYYAAATYFRCLPLSIDADYYAATLFIASATPCCLFDAIVIFRRHAAMLTLITLLLMLVSAMP